MPILARLRVQYKEMDNACRSMTSLDSTLAVLRAGKRGVVGEGVVDRRMPLPFLGIGGWFDEVRGSRGRA